MKAELKSQSSPKSAEQTEKLGLADALGLRLRFHREQASTSIRELARRTGVSPSLISQIEHGRVTPSVDTLYRISNELGISVDRFFNDSDTDSGQPAAAEVTVRQGGESGSNPPQASGGVVQPARNRKMIQLSGGVTWERLTPNPDDQVEFLLVTYQPGSESCPKTSLLRHGGKEYATVLSGRFGVTIGFEDYEVGPGDSIAFDAFHPHRIYAIGNEPATAIWVILNRGGDARLGHEGD